jgi:hypothetical protein
VLLGRTRLALAVLLIAAGPASAESLGEALREHGIKAARGMPLDTPITSYAVLDDPQRFVIAYYKDHGGNALVAPLYISRLERTSAQWTHATLDERSIRAAAPACLGSVLSVRPAGRTLLVETHINPSASCTLVLGQDLTIGDVVYGWPLAVLPDGRVLYEHSQVHFASVHPLEISLYDPRTRKRVPLYPPAPPPPLRAAYVLKVRAAYTEAWCNAQNHPCDPDRFDERLAGSVAVNAATRALALAVVFDDRALRGQAAGAVYVYRGIEGARLPEFRELRRDDINTQCGNEAIASCLDPAALARLFAP